MEKEKQKISILAKQLRDLKTFKSKMAERYMPPIEEPKFNKFQPFYS